MYKILLADDEYLEREALNLIISENISYASVIAKATSGKEAVDLCKKFNPNIIFMDIKMPGLNGIEASKKIKEFNPNIKIILLTAYDEFSLAHQAIRLGIDDYILKPATNEDIINAINKQIENIKKTEPFDENLKYYPKSKEIKTVVEYINNNYNKKISLHKLSKLVNLEQSYLSRLFKKEMGISYVDYVTEKKIYEAKEMLSKPDIPILNVALDLGYKNSNYFSRVFKKITGINPSEYRNNSLIKKYNQ